MIGSSRHLAGRVLLHGLLLALLSAAAPGCHIEVDPAPADVGVHVDVNVDADADANADGLRGTPLDAHGSGAVGSVAQARRGRRAAWTPTQLMTTARWAHTATKLADGRVLLAGGSPVGAKGTAEIYDPAHDTWTRTKHDMPSAHSDHVAARLCDGRVLVAGGFGLGGGASRTAALYDPVADTWAAAKLMHDGHTYGSATVLDDCRVLVAGGYDALARSELYDPAAGTWIAIASPLSQTRFYHTATRLRDGRVVVAGGGYDDLSVWYTLGLVDVYDPAKNAWSPLHSLHRRRRSHAAALLPSGDLLVTGGSDGGFDNGTGAAVELDSAEIYDVAKKQWRPLPALAAKRTTHTATLLDNGAVLIAGGIDDTGSALSSTETYQSSVFSPTASMNRDRYQHTATMLDDGAVLVAGGLHQATAELYRLAQNGSECTQGGGCASGFCVAGTCCDTACDDGCSSCVVPGAVGTCAAPCADATHALGCAAGAVCTGGAGCEARSCSPFLCTAGARGCATACTSVRDCAPGFACGLDHRCVAPPSMSEGDAGACSVEPPSGGRDAMLGLGPFLAAVALGWRRARRRDAPAT